MHSAGSIRIRESESTETRVAAAYSVAHLTGHEPSRRHNGPIYCQDWRLPYLEGTVIVTVTIIVIVIALVILIDILIVVVLVVGTEQVNY